MADEQLTDDEYNAIAKRIAAANPKGMSEADFTAQMADATSKYAVLPKDMRGRMLGPRQEIEIKKNLPALAAMAVSAGFVNPATTTAIGRIAGPAVAGSRWLQPIASGMGATGGALARGDQPMDAVEEGAKTAAFSRYVPAAVEKVMNLPATIRDKGTQMARGYLKPALDAGRQEAARMFGRTAQASEANDKIVDRALQRGILGADNPEEAIQNAMTQTENKLQGVVGDQPTRMSNIMNAVFQRGHKAAVNAPANIPGAQNTIDENIEGILTGRLGGKLDYGTPRPPARTNTLSAQPLLNAMRGTEASAGKIAPPDPKIIHGLQRIDAQPAGGNITTGVPVSPSPIKGPAMAAEAIEGQPATNLQTPRRFAGGEPTQVMREAPPGSQTGDLIAKNFTPPVKASPTTMPLVAAHRPQNITAKEALDFGRDFGRRNSWEKAPNDLTDWFNRQVESGARTAVKQAVPESRELLGELGDLSSLKRVISQAANREGNKNAFMRLPAMLAALKASNPVVAGGTVAGMAAADRNTGKIAQSLYNVGRRQPMPATISGTKQATLAAALMELLKARSNDQGGSGGQ